MWTSLQTNIYDSNNALGYFVYYMTPNVKTIINTAPMNLQPEVVVSPRNIKINNHVFKFISSDVDGNGVDRDTHVVLLIGPTGAGKSRIINVITESYITESSIDVVSVSIDVRFYYYRYSNEDETNRKICLVDTMGISDNRLTTDELIKLLRSRIRNTVQHYNTVLLVSRNRILNDQFSNIKNLLTDLNGIKKENIHLVLSGFEFQPEEIRMKNIALASQMDSVKDVICISDEKHPSPDRIVCTGFADYSSLDNQIFKEQFDSDKVSIANIITKKYKKISPNQKWLSCVIL